MNNPAGSVDRPIPERSKRAWDPCADVSGADHGLRRGELLALRWEDLDVQNRTLSINKSVARQDGKLVISTPKTPNSIRTVLLPTDTVKLLVEEHEKHPANPYLFPSPRTGEHGTGWLPQAS